MPGLYIKLPNNTWLVADGTECDPDPIEGLVDLVPALVSNSSGGWVCQADHEYNENGTYARAHKIWDRVHSGNWADAWNAGYGAYPHDNQLDSPAPLTIKVYSLQIRSGANTLYPGTWKLQGWNGTGWDDLHSASGVTWIPGEIKTYVVPAPAAYSRHRLYVTAGGVQCEISEAHLYG